MKDAAFYNVQLPNRLILEGTMADVLVAFFRTDWVRKAGVENLHVKFGDDGATCHVEIDFYEIEEETESIRDE